MNYKKLAVFILFAFLLMNDLLIGGPGLAGLIVLLLTYLFLFLYDRFISRENVFINVFE